MGAFRFAVAGTTLALALACQPVSAQDAGSQQQQSVAPMKLDTFMNKTRKKSVKSTKSTRQARAKKVQRSSRKSSPPAVQAEATPVAAQMKPANSPFSQFKDDKAGVGADVSAFAPTDPDDTVRVRSVRVKPANVPLVSPHDLNEIDLGAAPKPDTPPATTTASAEPIQASAPAPTPSQPPAAPLQTASAAETVLQSEAPPAPHVLSRLEQEQANRAWLLPLIAALGGSAVVASAGLMVFRRS